MMNIFVESLKRLFLNNKIKIEKLDEFLVNCKLTQEEFDYIKRK